MLFLALWDEERQEAKDGLCVLYRCNVDMGFFFFSFYLFDLSNKLKGTEVESGVGMDVVGCIGAWDACKTMQQIE